MSCCHSLPTKHREMNLNKSLGGGQITDGPPTFISYMCNNVCCTEFARLRGKIFPQDLPQYKGTLTPPPGRPIFFPLAFLKNPVFYTATCSIKLAMGTTGDEPHWTMALAALLPLLVLSSSPRRGIPLSPPERQPCGLTAQHPLPSGDLRKAEQTGKGGGRGCCC